MLLFEVINHGSIFWFLRTLGLIHAASIDATAATLDQLGEQGGRGVVGGGAHQIFLCCGAQPQIEADLLLRERLPCHWIELAHLQQHREQ